jgi:hypothetical protein
MKYSVNQLKSLAVALKELEPFVRSGRHLETGKPFRSMGDMRSREALANWLLCAAISWVDGRSLMFCSDPLKGDGSIVDTATGEAVAQTEHVMVAGFRVDEEADLKTLILRAVKQKRA